VVAVVPPVVTVTVLVSVTVEAGALTVTVRDPPVVTVVAGAVTVTVAPPGLEGSAVWPAAGIFAAFAGLTGSVRPCSTLCGCAAATHTPRRAPRVSSKSAPATAAAVRLVADQVPACRLCISHLIPAAGRLQPRRHGSEVAQPHGRVYIRRPWFAHA
jgi:hypothetical protein